MSIGIRVNMVVLVVLGLLLLATLLLVNEGVMNLTNQTGREQGLNDGSIIQVELTKRLELLQTATRALALTPEMIESVQSGDMYLAENAVITASSTFDMDDIDLVGLDGERLVDLVEVSQPENEDEILSIALQGLPISGLLIDDAEQQIRLVAAYPLRDPMGEPVGAVMTSDYLDGQLLRELVFDNENIYLALIYNDAIIAHTGYRDRVIKDYQSMLFEQQNIIDEALQGELATAPELLQIEGQPHALVYVPIAVRGEPRAVIGVLSNMGSSQVLLTQFTERLTLVVSMLAIGALVIMTLFLRFNIVRPLRSLQRAADNMAHGNYDQRVMHTRSDEIGQVSQAFHMMAQAVQEREETLQHLALSLEERNRELKIQSIEASDARMMAEQANLAKSQFLANMSHELRTPLNAILGYSEMLIEEADDMGITELRPDLDRIYAAGRHLLALINDILDISKIEAGKMDLYLERFALTGLIHDVTSTIEPLVAQKHNRLVVQHTDHLGEMHADQTKVQQVLLNLLSNAAKFTEAGHVTLHVSRRPERPDMSLQLVAQAEHGDSHKFAVTDWMVFEVSDTGIGMTTEQQEKIFQAFSQADASTTRRYGGTGLGLAISRHFCQMMGGDIVVRSDFGQGSTFTVYLPVDVTHAQSDSTKTAREDGKHAFHEQDMLDIKYPESDTAEDLVLVIDDDPDACDLMRRLLKAEGFQVIAALSGQEGIHLARKLRPSFITLDVMMAGMDGWQVLAALREDPELVDIPIIMVTIVDEKQVGFTLGATDYLTKPINREQVLALLQRYQRHSRRAPFRILVADDDPLVRELLRRILETQDWHVIEARDGQHTLELVETESPDCLLLDIMMPKVDGFEVVRTLRAHAQWKDLPIIVLSARILDPEEESYLRHSVERILQKGSYNHEELLFEVRELINKRLHCQ
ncbi:MAG: response regulator [Chloroflexaceae bacterium]|nr:response regulator [Chloroflexaceae bacterium]